MSIKSQKPKKNSQYKQGYFKPRYPEKYIGKGDLIYRSSWEEKFCIYCDTNPNITAWAIEPERYTIPYISVIDQKEHSYHPDFYVKLKDDSDQGFRELLVEIKPTKDLRRPEKPTRLSEKALKTYKYGSKTYLINMCKFKYAKKYAEAKGMQFLFVTEKWFRKEKTL